MPRIERTKEEREHFRIELGDVLEKLAEVHDHPYRRGDDDEAKKARKDNAKAISDLMDYLRHCDVLVGVCGELAKKTLEQEPMNMGDRLWMVTVKDINTLKRAIKALQEERETAAKAAGKVLGETPAVVMMWQAISRVNKVHLFDLVFNAGKYVYKEWVPGRNQISGEQFRVRWFGGIPEDKLPIKYIKVKSGNATITLIRRDRSISAENCERIYNILKILEKEQPTVKIPAKRGDPSSGKVTVERAGEADFFLSQLPPGLKPWVAEVAD